MSLLFSSLRVGPMTIKNRFMRSPTYESLANPDGTPKPRLLHTMKHLSDGEVGLIIPGFVCTMESGRAQPRQTCFYNQKHADAWKPTIDAIHKNDSKIVFQLAHGGIGTVDSLEKRGPSTFPGLIQGLTTAEVEDIIESFQKAAVLTKKAGADGAQIHAAHGYLYSTFLSPFYNRRNDKYGGSLDGRARIVAETAEAIRKSCGPDFSVLIKMNANDFLPGGMTPDLASRYVNILKNKIDLFEISCGLNNFISTIRPAPIRKIVKYTYGLKFEEGYNLSYAEQIKRDNPDTIIASVGGFRTVSMMEDAIKKVDMVSLSRPLIREPDLVKKIHENKTTKSACISCNHCLIYMNQNPLGAICDYP